MLEVSRAKPLIVACIPAFNEELTIAKVIVKAQKYVDKVIVCDDGSTDMTSEIAEALGADVTKHGMNFGYGATLASLFSRARELGADVMVTLDADGQHDPDDIPRLIKPIIAGEADIVIGSRFSGRSAGNIPSYRRVGIRIITTLVRKVSYKGIKDAQSGFRAYSKRAIELIKPAEMGMGVSTEILMRAGEYGLKIKEIPVTISYGKNTSTRNPLYHGLDVVLSTVKYFSTRHPLMFYGIPGVASLIVASVSGLMLIHLFNVTRYFSLPLALIAVGFGLMGAIMCSTAVMLWVLVSLVREKY